MKYHYQFVSPATVRIELIPEDKKETLLIQRLSEVTLDGTELTGLFEIALRTYSPGATLTRIKFMNFPKVALCNFAIITAPIEKIA